MANAQRKNAQDWVDPRFVQISRIEAARILGRSPTEFDRMRKNDPECPKGFKDGSDRGARVRFRLSEVYAYSDTLMMRASNDSAEEEE
ncbi:hypothetical protein SAMN05661010_02565 [Modicisalibacter muralis]|uniref:Helix-turn-helix domain-containing protein n=1 Tax=Modicisalibacter muralis TaxID=119000 RepID=A0A1G9MZR2_9GAMM|nr:hypothetical protein [Halomonas muralis]SDL79105.1 hypothetical protein SAMN05661010_02565 [Halomonas muralis]